VFWLLTFLQFQINVVLVSKFLIKSSVSQRGVVHPAVLLLFIVAIGLVAFLLISSTAPLGGKLGNVYQKPASRAAEGYVTRIDSGSDVSYTDSAGNVWSADVAHTQGSYGYTPGGSNYTGETSLLPGVVDQKLYSTTRFGTSFGYKFDVPNGWYRVNLKLAEVRYTSCSVGARVFDVLAEGQVVISHNDTFARVGCVMSGDRSFETQVNDGELNIDFTSVAGLAAINGIEVMQIPAPTVPPTVAPTIEPTIAPSTPSPTPALLTTPSSSYKRVFLATSVNNQFFNGNLGGIIGASNKCQQVANRAPFVNNGQLGLGGTWKAWIAVRTSTFSDDPIFEFTHSTVPYRLVNGTTVANSWTDLIDGTLLAPINVDEVGNPAGNQSVWTNVSLSGRGNGLDNSNSSCSTWVDGGGASGAVGNSGATNRLWTDTTTQFGAGNVLLNGIQSCDRFAALYCFEQ
jgi:hypothetical protein